MEKTLEQKIYNILFSSQFEKFHKKFVENAEDEHSKETFQEIQKVFKSLLAAKIGITKYFKSLIDSKIDLVKFPIGPL